MVSTRQLLAVVAAALPVCLAATSTCDPLSASTCSPDPALSSSTFSTDWTSSSELGNGWTTTAGSIEFGSNGAEFIIKKEGDAPTIETDFYIFFGKVEVKMQAASGTGIVSSVVMMSDVEDEIDWEFTGGDTTQTQTNYFGKGNTTTYDRAIWYSVSSPQTTSHTYTVDWTSSTITWYIDGTAVRTLDYADANGGTNYPQTPCRVKLGIWAGGDPSNPPGTIEWAGGETDFSQAPFTMYVESVSIQNYSPGSEYVYKDETGDMDSIEVVSGSSDPAATSSGSAAAESGTSSITTVPAGTTKTSAASASVPTTVKSSVEKSATLSTIPLESATSAKAVTAKTSTTMTSGKEASGTQSSGAATSASATSATAVTTSANVTPAVSSTTGSISASGTVISSSSDASVIGRGENALAALLFFLCAALYVL